MCARQIFLPTPKKQRRPAAFFFAGIGQRCSLFWQMSCFFAHRECHYIIGSLFCQYPIWEKSPHQLIHHDGGGNRGIQAFRAAAHRQANPVRRGLLHLFAHAVALVADDEGKAFRYALPLIERRAVQLRGQDAVPLFAQLVSSPGKSSVVRRFMRKMLPIVARSTFGLNTSAH